MNLIVMPPSLAGLEEELVYRLKICYIDIFLEDKVDDYDNWFVGAIRTSILTGNHELQTFFSNNANNQYSTDRDSTIFSEFMQQIKSLTDSAFRFAISIQTQFNAITDISSILLPYILQKTQVCNEDIGIFIGVAVVISQLIVQHLADQDAKKKEQETKDSIESICHSNLYLLQELAKKDDGNKGIIEQGIKENLHVLDILNDEKR